jgi:ketosteroid isomerase-like protein
MPVHLCVRILFLAATLVGTSLQSVDAADQGGEPFVVSSEPTVAAGQRSAYDVVHRYEAFLNAGDTDGILDLFAPDGVAEWNDKPTFATLQAKRDAYAALFRVARFTTVFGYAGIGVHGETAVVQTFHHKGATMLEGGKQVVDLNREVFVLRKIDGAWKITLYVFNTNPVQGEG